MAKFRFLLLLITYDMKMLTFSVAYLSFCRFIILSVATSPDYHSPIMVSQMKSQSMMIINNKGMVYELPSNAVDLDHDELRIKAINRPIDMFEKWPFLAKSLNVNIIKCAFYLITDGREYLYFAKKKPEKDNESPFLIKLNLLTNTTILVRMSAANPIFWLATNEPNTFYQAFAKSSVLRVEKCVVDVSHQIDVSDAKCTGDWTICEYDKKVLLLPSASCKKPYQVRSATSFTSGFVAKNKFYLFSGKSVDIIDNKTGFTSKSLHRFFNDDLFTSDSPDSNSSSNSSGHPGLFHYICHFRLTPIHFFLRCYWCHFKGHKTTSAHRHWGFGHYWSRSLRCAAISLLSSFVQHCKWIEHTNCSAN